MPSWLYLKRVWYELENTNKCDAYSVHINCCVNLWPQYSLFLCYRFHLTAQFCLSLLIFYRVCWISINKFWTVLKRIFVISTCKGIFVANRKVCGFDDDLFGFENDDFSNSPAIMKKCCGKFEHKSFNSVNNFIFSFQTIQFKLSI